MSKKNDPAQADLKNAARLHDGWAYIVLTPFGKFRLNDPDPRAAIRSRWLEARGTDGVLSFEGARRAIELDNGSTEVLPVEGAGDVLATNVIGFRYAGIDEVDSDTHEAAIEAARALLEIQGAATQEALGGMGGGDEPDQTEGATTITDDDLDGEFQP